MSKYDNLNKAVDRLDERDHNKNVDEMERCLLVYSPEPPYHCKGYGIVEYTQKSSSLNARNNDEKSTKQEFRLANGLAGPGIII